MSMGDTTATSAQTVTATHDYQTILFESAGNIARLTLNRPERMNALGADMSSEILDALTRVEVDTEVRVLVITGAGRGFCAGANLGSGEITGGMPDLGKVLEEQYNPIVEKLRALSVPVVCAVNGVAAGAGANFALACDIVIATRSARFIQAFAKIGLLPDMGGTHFLTQLVGPARAMGLALLAEPLSAEQAAEWGLIWRCVDDEEFAQATTELAQRLASGPPLALAHAKRAIHAAAENSLTQQLALERDLQRELGRTQDFVEGVTAFFDKRSAQFKGR
jgi:2-(1,2-epoxy-1,2-dihydrophenyl)acetyl-CoA isomerase